MGTFLLWVVAAAVVGLILFGIAAALSGRAEPMADVPHDGRPAGLPTHRVARAEEVREAAFDLAFRGYRMAEVDAVLDRVADEIAVRDAEIARLCGRQPGGRSASQGTADERHRPGGDDTARAAESDGAAERHG